MAKYYKDWRSLYNEAVKDGVKDVAQYILDNTNDARASKGATFDKDYVKDVREWVKTQKSKVSESINHIRTLAGLPSLNESAETKEMMVVIDNEFNRSNYPDLVGKKYPKDKVPSYVRVKPVTESELDESRYPWLDHPDRPGERSVSPAFAEKPDAKNDLASIKQRAINDVRSSILNQDLVSKYMRTIRGTQNGEQLYDVIYDLAKQGVFVDGKTKSADWDFLLEPNGMNESEEEVEWVVTMPIENPDVVGRNINRMANEKGIDYEDIGWDAEGNFTAICSSRSDASRFASLLRNRFRHPTKNQLPKITTQPVEYLSFPPKSTTPQTESKALDRARYDADSGDKKKATLKKEPWEKDDDNKSKDSKTESEQMREWSNSLNQNYEDRGNVMDQPSGETVDLSLRRYLNAQPYNVKVQEDIVVENLAKEYNTFKKSKK